MGSSLNRFSSPTRAWFEGTFAAPTAAQEQGWSAIASGEHTLILAPTGSGKTLAAFLWCLDQLATSPTPANPKERCRVLYVSPLKALAHDVERNLKAPLVGINLAAQRLGQPRPAIEVAIRTGDTSAKDRRDINRTPPDILITTPESLYLLLTSQAEEILKSVRYVIVDEIHSVAGTKRGAHLALSLERLEHVVSGPLQRIGLSATQRPLDEIGRFLGGVDRQVTLVDVGKRKRLDLQVIVPLEDMANPGAGQPVEPPAGGAVLGANLRAESQNSIWPSIYPRLLELIKANRSTLLFVNSRRLAERLAQRLNELYEAETDAPGGPPLVRAHHGSISREQRLVVEEMLKAGTLRGLVATSSLELGIDMGAIDMVIQVESPISVSSGLQRIGRAGHTVDATSSGKIFPKYRGDLLEAAVVVRRMLDAAIESTRVPRNPLDVLAQQIVAMCSQRPWGVDELYATVRRAYNFATLPRTLFEGTLDMLSGRYPSDEFSNLKARLIWDRMADTVVARGDARIVAVTSGGTIPERGLYGVFLGEGGPRVGELDEEMVYESRPGETFVLGASTWRIERITPQQVIVSPAPGEPGKTPFWHGDAAGRPIELGRALGEFSRKLVSMDEAKALETLAPDHRLDDLAARNLLAYLAEQKATTGAVPSDRTIVVERFRDELGDWRLCILTPFGGRVHAPWALAVGALVRERLGVDLYAIWTDDGIAIRLPEGLEDSPIDEFLFPDADRAEDLVVRELSGSALFAARFRENAARALLLPRRRGDARTPLWQMRQRAADLLAVASRYGSFPILLETYRECLQDVFDLPALQEVLRGIQQRHIHITAVETASASPFARSLLFDYIAEFMYEGDAPMAERRAQALALDRERLRELLGQEELRELLDPAAIDDLELELQGLAERKARTRDQLHDLLRRVGDLTSEDVAARTAGESSAEWLAELAAERRAFEVRIAGERRWVAVEDVARYRDAVGVQPPRGVPEIFLQATTDALDSLLLRWARTHAPFIARDPATRWGLPAALVQDTLRRLEQANVILRGEFRPGGTQSEWCDQDVLRSLRRRSLARLRREVEPVPAAALARFLPAWHGVGSDAGSLDRLVDVVTQLEGLFLPWSVYERDVLAARVRGYQPRLLDELCASGELVWVGRGSIGTEDGRVALFRRDRLVVLAPTSPE
ncbi:MAG TPA: DEAD/DEAH box helicase, partial [Chloroflexota bacterium]|nr:DEAD/DEAH box helicase [Chloroflexota bacterium]